MKKIKLISLNLAVLVVLLCGACQKEEKQVAVSTETETVTVPETAKSVETEMISEEDTEDIVSESETELLDLEFYKTPITEEIKNRIMGISYQENNHIALEDLNYLHIPYYGFDQEVHEGEMIVNKAIADDVLEIFEELYNHQYPIEKMNLIDEYNGDDETSMEDNNTSAFNYRTIAGTDKLSNHSYGKAIDLNPLYNPYVKTKDDGTIICEPENAMQYTDRTIDSSHEIDHEDLAYQVFTEHGFTWGGDWISVKDYQHFEHE